MYTYVRIYIYTHTFFCICIIYIYIDVYTVYSIYMHITQSHYFFLWPSKRWSYLHLFLHKPMPPDGTCSQPAMESARGSKGATGRSKSKLEEMNNPLQYSMFCVVCSFRKHHELKKNKIQNYWITLVVLVAAPVRACWGMDGLLGKLMSQSTALCDLLSNRTTLFFERHF